MKYMARWFRTLIVSIFWLATAPSTQSAEPHAFPVEISHSFGSTVIETEPERIVIVGWSSEDISLLLGKVPIAIPQRAFFEDGIFPWNRPYLGATEPVILDELQIDFETIAALKPDCILAVHSGISNVEYGRLSRIAPTVAYKSGPWKADWREQTRLVGQALGQPQKAELLIAQTEHLIARLGSAHPELNGLTFVFGVMTPNAGTLRVYLPRSDRVAMLTTTGLAVAPGIIALANENPGKSDLEISLEELDLIDADILILASGLRGRETLEMQPLLSLMRPIRNNSYVLLDDPELLWASSAISVSSLQSSYLKLVAAIAEAAQRFRQRRP